MSNIKLASFDWAMSRLLKSKANFVVLEGFLSELLMDDIKILVGLHHKDHLKLSPKYQKFFQYETPDDLFPEYYLININKFDNVAKTPLDEWIYFLKNETIEDSFTAKGLKKAKEVLDIMKLSPAERRDYENFLDNQRSKRSSYDTATYKGIQKGREEEARATVLRMFNRNYDIATISDLTGLSLEKVQAIIDSVTN
jgi:predicted transposase/invertase (TIGR01784 family)